MLTRSEIRRRVIRSGKFNLETTEGRAEMDSYLHKLDRWLNVGSMHNRLREWGLKKAVFSGPRKILEAVEFANGQMIERNMKRIYEAAGHQKNIYFYGDGAREGTVAIAKQLCFVNDLSPAYYSLSDIASIADGPMPDGLACYGGYVTMIDTSFDSEDGKVWTEKAHRVSKALGAMWGIKILFNLKNEKRLSGSFGKILWDVFNPELRMKITKRENGS